MEIRKERGLVVVELGEAHRAISTLPTPPQIARIAFKQVDKDFSESYEAEAARVRKALGEDTAVFLTAAKLPESFGVRAEGPISVAATVAMSPTSCVGGTINVAVIADAPLSKWGMVDLLRTAVEAPPPSWGKGPRGSSTSWSSLWTPTTSLKERLGSLKGSFHKPSPPCLRRPPCQ